MLHIRHMNLTCASADGAVVCQWPAHCLYSNCVQLSRYEILKVGPVVLLWDTSHYLDTCVLKQEDCVVVHVSCAGAPRSPETPAEHPGKELEVRNPAGNCRGGWRKKSIKL